MKKNNHYYHIYLLLAGLVELIDHEWWDIPDYILLPILFVSLIVILLIDNWCINIHNSLWKKKDKNKDKKNSP